MTELEQLLEELAIERARIVDYDIALNAERLSYKQQGEELAEARRQLGVWAPIPATLVQLELELIKIHMLIPGPMAQDCLGRLLKVLTTLAETRAYLKGN